MARPIRVEYEGASYHVTARGNERKLIYRSDDDRKLFLRTLMQMVRVYGVVLEAYCLMPNHYHLAITTPLGNLIQAIGWLQTTYTIRFNKRHKRSGIFFREDIKRKLSEEPTMRRNW